MPPDPEIVVASNRGPVSFVASGDGFETRRGAGGLAGALDPVVRGLGGGALWIATATSRADRDAVAAGALDGLAGRLGYPVELLDIDEEVYDRYYDVVSNRMLWFANHCLWDELGIEGPRDDEVGAFDDAYEAVNRRFARAVASAAGEGTLVLFQDYHLATAPAHLRRLLRTRSTPGLAVSHFTHSSFSGPEGFAPLPAPIPRRIIEGMLGADLVGFHVQAWVDNFLDCCEWIGAEVDRERGRVGFEGRDVWVREYPIPIDAGHLRARADRPEARRWSDRFEGGPEKVRIVRADRTEPSKNIVRGFEAFGMLLDRRADLRGRVRFIACVYPSRQSMPEYRSYADAIRAVVDDVNARHPSSIDLFIEDDFDRTLGALRVYDVLLVNPLMDGMNLVSKEGPAVNERWGALVLSRGAGSYEELGAYAVGIEDARDVQATVRALESAVDLPDHERRRRAVRLTAVAGASEPRDWIGAQTVDLRSIVERGEPRSTSEPAR
ncbi:MAG: trehalose-6-phosphate synthase [Actinomycetota bacterium]